MNGRELYQRVVTTVQEMQLKIGDSEGSITLYYPLEGDFGELSREFGASIEGMPDGPVLERLPGRVRVIVSESDCRAIAEKPIIPTLKEIVSLINAGVTIDELERGMKERFPECVVYEVDDVEFDRVMVFPQRIDPDVYCLDVEMGKVTYHRFSVEDFVVLGFEPPPKPE